MTPFPNSLLVEIAKASIAGTRVSLRDVAHTPEDWATLADVAETHQLAPLAYACLCQECHDVPRTTIRSLEALVLRHRAWHRERTAALTEILREFERRSIEALVLKGSALAWIVYASPWLRPMVDLDLLVAPAAAPAAQAALDRLGFRIAPPCTASGKECTTTFQSRVDPREGCRSTSRSTSTPCRAIRSLPSRWAT